jgi:hypothetical protein
MSDKKREDGLLAQVPTLVLGLLIILLVVPLVVMGATLAHYQVPAELRQSHTAPSA